MQSHCVAALMGSSQADSLPKGIGDVIAIDTSFSHSSCPKRTHCRKALVTLLQGEWEPDWEWQRPKRTHCRKALVTRNHPLQMLDLFQVVPSGLTAERHW